MRVYQRRVATVNFLAPFNPAEFEAVADVVGDDLDFALRSTFSNTPGGWQKAAIGNPLVRMLREVPAEFVCFTKAGDVVERAGQYFVLGWDYHGKPSWKLIDRVPVPASAAPTAPPVATGETMSLF